MKRILVITILLVFTAFVVSGQTTEFKYQGSLTDGAGPANGNYDFEFVLYDALNGGNQVGATLARNGVVVTNGIFAAQLDFGNQFPGAARYLEIHVRLTGQPGFTPLTPRQPISNTPYAVKSLNADTAANATNATNATTAATATNALQLGGVAANQSVLTTDSRMTDTRSPTAGSPNYVQNATSQQAASNFNISGTGTANIFNAATQYNIAGQRVLSQPGGIAFNVFAGQGAGSLNTTGSGNSFFGQFSGENNTSGQSNSFFGYLAGYGNALGNFNAYFGRGAGNQTTGGNNSYFGTEAGFCSTTGSNNSFFGFHSGSGFPVCAGGTGTGNSFFGYNAGTTNTSGQNNTAIGNSADVGSGALTFATAIGANAVVSQSNSLVLGGINSVNGATADTKVGIGTTSPARLFHVSGAGSDGSGQTDLRITGTGQIAAGITLESTGLSGRTYSLLSTADNTGGGGTGPGRLAVIDVSAGAYRMVIDAGGNLGLGTISPQDKLDVAGTIRVSGLGSAGSTSLCRNASNQISTCSSYIRYKQNVNPFVSGLSLIKQLRPVSFNWRSNNQADLGLVAEDVAKVEPLLTTRNDKGEIEGVKYDRVSVVLVNAVKEQQAQIEEQEKQNQSQQIQIDLQQKQIEQQQIVIRKQQEQARQGQAQLNKQQEQARVEQEQLSRQQAQLDALKRLVCSSHRRARVCR